MNASRTHRRSRTLRALICGATCLQPGIHAERAAAETVPRFCNGGDLELQVVVVQDYWRPYQRLWKEFGWFYVAAGQCNTLPTIPEHRVAGYGFRAFKDGVPIYPKLSPEGSASSSLLSSGRICVNPESDFEYGPRSAGDVGYSCPDGEDRVPLSFYYSTERVNFGREPTEYLTLNLEWSSDTTFGSGRESRVQDASPGPSLRHKFILMAFLDKAYDKTSPRSDEIYLGSELLSGDAELDAFHGMLRMNLPFLEEEYIGADGRFEDKWELRDSALTGYDYDNTSSAVTVSDFGLELFEVLGSRMDLLDLATSIEHRRR